jgi:hypothetical protein
MRSSGMHRLLTVGVLLIVCAGCGKTALPDTQMCSDPAPLHGHYDQRAPGYFVGLQKGTWAQFEARRLAWKHGFSVKRIYRQFFFALMSPEVSARLRCEKSVSYVEHNGLTFLLDYSVAAPPNYALERTVMDKVRLGFGRASASHARRTLVTRGRPAAQRDR